MPAIHAFKILNMEYTLLIEDPFRGSSRLYRSALGAASGCRHLVVSRVGG